MRDALALVGLDMRVGAWRGDAARVERGIARLRATHRPLLFEAWARIFQEPVPSDDADEDYWRLVSSLSNHRIRTVFFQLGTEVFSPRNEPARAERYLKGAAEGVLLDLEWLEHCPALAALRGTAAFVAARVLVAARVHELGQE